MEAEIDCDILDLKLHLRCGETDEPRKRRRRRWPSGEDTLWPQIRLNWDYKRESIARTRSPELVRDSFRQIKKQNAEDDVNGEKLDAFDPVRFAVAADLKQDVNRSDYGEDFRPRKLEVHRLAKQIGDE